MAMQHQGEVPENVRSVTQSWLWRCAVCDQVAIVASYCQRADDDILPCAVGNIQLEEHQGNVAFHTQVICVTDVFEALRLFLGLRPP